MSFQNTLYYILEDLRKHKRSRNDSMEAYVSTRLEESLKSYEHNTSQSVDFLTARNSINVLKKLNREWIWIIW